MRANGPVALLVGAGDAIGAAVARRFAAEKFQVCVARRDAAKAQKLIDEAAAAGGSGRAVRVEARELGPKNVHVAHLVIDGGVDSEAIRKRMRARLSDAVDSLPADSLIQTRSIADAYWSLHVQPRNAWTHELDLRPAIEKW